MLNWVVFCVGDGAGGGTGLFQDSAKDPGWFVGFLG